MRTIQVPTQPLADHLWRLSVITVQGAADAIAAALEADSQAISAFEIVEGGAWVVDAVLLSEPDLPELQGRMALAAATVGLPPPDVSAEKLPAVDWLKQVYESFPPRRLGRFMIRGSHHRDTPAFAPIVMTVDAGTAFGSGEHPTTEGCLRMLDALGRQAHRKGHRPKRILDMGCGSGILALAAAQQWRRPVLAIDIDTESVRVARENARENGVRRWVRAEAGDGYQTPSVRRGAPYDLIVANILARPLIKLAPDARRHLKKGGMLVLSGLLKRQQKAVLAAHRAQGFKHVRSCPIGDWQTLVLKR